jgi:hypothetical protein
VVLPRSSLTSWRQAVEHVTTCVPERLFINRNAFFRHPTLSHVSLGEFKDLLLAEADGPDRCKR